MVPAWIIARLFFLFPRQNPVTPEPESSAPEFILELLSLRQGETLIVGGIGLILAFFIPWAWTFLTWLFLLPCGKNLKQQCIRQAAEKRGDHLEVLLENAQVQSDLVELSLSNGKTYIGFIVESGIMHHDGDNADISLIPAYSGYRGKYTQKLFIDYDYSRMALLAQKQFLKDAPKDVDNHAAASLKKLDLRVVVSASQVDIARVVPGKDAERQFEYQRTAGFRVFGETEGGEALSSLRGAAAQK